MKEWRRMADFFLMVQIDLWYWWQHPICKKWYHISKTPTMLLKFKNTYRGEAQWRKPLTDQLVMLHAVSWISMCDVVWFSMFVAVSWYFPMFLGVSCCFLIFPDVSCQQLQWNRVHQTVGRVQFQGKNVDFTGKVPCSLQRDVYCGVSSLYKMGCSKTTKNPIVKCTKHVNTW